MSFKSGLLIKCRNCNEPYTDMLDAEYKLCEQCELLITNFTKWTSRNEKIDDFIQEMQLKINGHAKDKVFEWVPYDQFRNIEEIGKSGLVYSAVWKDGPIKYDHKKEEWTKESDKKVELKCLYDSQNNVDELLNKV